MALGMYILQGTQAIPCNDLMAWGIWMQDSEKRRVAFDEFEGVKVSTIFLGLDMNMLGNGDPELFETMVNNDVEGWGEQHRYFIWEEALEGHNRIVDRMRAKLIAAKAKGIQIMDKTMNQTKGIK